MSAFRVSVEITPRRGVLDPQGAAVAGALRTLGFSAVSDVRIGRLIVVSLDAPNESAARKSTAAMCEKLLANPVIEDYVIGQIHPE